MAEMTHVPVGEDQRLSVFAPHSQPALDALRGLASLAVLVTHVSFQTATFKDGTLGAIAARLDVGVAIFFVLSGYLLTAPRVTAADQGRPRPSDRRYFWHRALRILPAYWVACIAVLFLPENSGTSAATAARNFALLQVYRPAQLLQAFTQTWSLCTEVLFYLLLPVLAALALYSLRRGRSASAAVVIGLMVVGNIAFIVLTNSGITFDRGLAGYWLPSTTSWFAGGMALAIARRSSARLPSRVRRTLDACAAAPFACWTLALATLLMASTPIAGPRGFESQPTAWQAVTKNLLYLVVAVCLTIPLAFGGDGPSRFRRHLSNDTWRYFGEISYGVFLWHLLVLSLVLKGRGDQIFSGDFLPVLLLTIAGSVMVASASLFVIERPALRLKDRGPGRAPPPPLSTGP